MVYSKFDGLNGPQVKMIMLKLLENGFFQPIKDADEYTYTPNERGRLRRIQKIACDLERKLTDSGPAQLFLRVDHFLNSPKGYALNIELEMLGLPSLSSFLISALHSAHGSRPR